MSTNGINVMIVKLCRKLSKIGKRKMCLKEIVR